MIIEEVKKPTLERDDDVIIKVVRACVCGSDLWSYAHGDDKAAHSENSGHEALGIVEEIGSAITTVKPGDSTAVAPEAKAISWRSLWRLMRMIWEAPRILAAITANKTTKRLSAY